MFEIILLLVGIAGFSLAGYLDLKTTEFPDWIPYSVIILALLVRGIFSFLLNDFSIIINSVIIGGLFLGFGLVLYFLRQWGDGDAWLFGSMGFLFPANPGFTENIYFQFPMTLFMNFFFVSFFYIIAYSVFLGIRNPVILKTFKSELKKNSKGLYAGISVFIAAYVALIFLFSGLGGIPTNFLMFPFLLILLGIFIIYAQVIETKFFRKKIPATKLKLGDVPLSERWRVLKPKEIEKLKKSGGYVWVKEGVRFAPVFVITLVVSLFWGDLFFWIFQIMV